MRGWPVLFAMLVVLRADPLEDAARALAKKIGAHVSTGDTVRVTERNISTQPASEAARARQTIERSMRRGPRNGTPVDVLVTLSENRQGAVLVAEIAKGEERWVELTTYPLRFIAVVTRPRPKVERRMIREQWTQILDIVETDSAMIVLDVNELAVYEQTKRVSGFPLLTSSRDPVARLIVEGDKVTVQAPDRECRGSWRPEAKLECTTTGEPGNLWHQPSSPPFFSMARINKSSLLAEPDGRLHLYTDGKHVGSWPGWGGELAAVCGGNVLGSSDRERERGDRLMLFDIAEGRPLVNSSALEFPGPITALHPRDTGALAIVHDLTTSKYAAYHIIVDCTQ